ncbi:MAG: DALR anticodon-binding domain-containing protein, partial [Candidatus Sedimenticola sp. 6PFRAG1]
EGDEERALHNQVTAKSNLVNPMLDQYDYEGSLIALADLKEPVDHFFDEVMVMADDPAIRNNRLALLNQLSGLFLGVADISRLQS